MPRIYRGVILFLEVSMNSNYNKICYKKAFEIKFIAVQSRTKNLKDQKAFECFLLKGQHKTYTKYPTIDQLKCRKPKSRSINRCKPRILENVYLHLRDNPNKQPRI